MKMIDVLNMMAKGEIKEGTRLITDVDLDDYAYQYSELYQSFTDRYMNRVEDDFFLDKDFLNIDVELIPPKEKRYLVKINIRGLQERFTYLNYCETSGRVNLHDKYRLSSIQTEFTKDELQSIKSVREFLEDMEGKYELIEVTDDEDD